MSADPSDSPSDLTEKLLLVLEEHGVPAPINDQIVSLVEGWEKTLPFGKATPRDE